jgi:Putative rhamnosyl transferase
MDQLRSPMTVYFVTRFSIYDPQFRGFRLTVDYEEKVYERRLFSTKRLDQKFATFQAITLPSVVQQSCDHWKWLIYTSDRMPDACMNRLRNLVKDYANIQVIPVTDFTDFFEQHKAYDFGNSFATVRLDDDDGLDRSFVEKLQQYSQNVGSVVSFTDGAFVRCTKGRMVVGETISERNSALGLAGIGLRIYLTGRHTDIHTRYNVIYDQSPGMFFLCCSPFTDTQRGFTRSARVLNKFRRLLFLILHRPTEARRECLRFVRKRLSRQPV